MVMVVPVPVRMAMVVVAVPVFAMPVFAMIVRAMVVIGAAFRIERRLDLDHIGAEVLQHVADHRIAADQDDVGLELGRQVPVADVPGKAQQGLRTVGAHRHQRLGPGDDAHIAATAQRQPIAAAQMLRAVQVQQVCGARGSGDDDTAAMTAVVVEHGLVDRLAGPGSGRGDAAGLDEVVELAEALCPSLERRRETLSQGEAFLIAAEAWGRPPLCGAVAYPVAVGALCGVAGIPLQPALAAWLHAFAANLVSVAVRLVPLGQTQGVSVIAGLAPLLLETAARSAVSTLDDLGAASLVSDIAAMRHETLPTRIFIT